MAATNREKLRIDGLDKISGSVEEVNRILASFERKIAANTANVNQLVASFDMSKLECYHKRHEEISALYEDLMIRVCLISEIIMFAKFADRFTPEQKLKISWAAIDAFHAPEDFLIEIKNDSLEQIITKLITKFKD